MRRVAVGSVIVLRSALEARLAVMSPIVVTPARSDCLIPTLIAPSTKKALLFAFLMICVMVVFSQSTKELAVFGGVSWLNSRWQ